jgi:hypothetical protein
LRKNPVYFHPKVNLRNLKYRVYAKRGFWVSILGSRFCETPNPPTTSGPWDPKPQRDPKPFSISGLVEEWKLSGKKSQGDSVFVRGRQQFAPKTKWHQGNWRNLFSFASWSLSNQELMEKVLQSWHTLPWIDTFSWIWRSKNLWNVVPLCEQELEISRRMIAGFVLQPRNLTCTGCWTVWDFEGISS